jgi:hypothetical protein
VKKSKNIAVITGDLVASSEVSSNQVNSMNEELSKYLDNKPFVMLPLTFYRGDSFQLMVKAEKSVEVALTIQSIILWRTETWLESALALALFRKSNPAMCFSPKVKHFNFLAIS